MSGKCDHPEKDRVEDVYEGTVICTACSFVVDNSYTHQRQDQELRHVCHFIDTIATNNNINSIITQEANDIKTRIRLLLPKRSDQHLAIFAIYTSALKNGNAYTTDEVAQMVNLPQKTIKHIIRTIGKLTGYRDFATDTTLNPLQYFNRLTTGFLSSKEQFQICKFYTKYLPPRFKSKLPRILIAGITYNYFLRRNILFKDQKLLLSIISSELCVSERRIISLEREIHGAIEACIEKNV